MKVGEVLDFTKERPLSSWFKLLDEKRTKTANERLLAEAVKVREDGVKLGDGDGVNVAVEMGLNVTVIMMAYIEWLMWCAGANVVVMGLMWW